MAFDFPNTPTTNQIVTMPDGTVRKWDGVKWVAGQTPVAPYCYTGDTPPSNSTPGASWWDSVSCQLFVYYNDGNSSQWVPAVAIPASVGEAPSNNYVYGRQNGQWANLGAIAQLQGNVGRNLIHNSMFNVAQRGTGPFTTSGWGLDRWLSAVGGSTMSTSRITLSDADRAAIGDEAARLALQCVGTGTAGAGDFIIPATQTIEDVTRLAGKTIVLSFWAKANAGTPKLGINIYQGFGTGGSPSAAVKLTSQALTLSTAWTRYTTMWNMPSISGKTIGTDPNTSMVGVQFWMSSGTTNNVDAGGIGVQSYILQLWGVQLEIGSVATQLEKIPYEDDLRHCQRFYQVLQGVTASYGLIGSTVAGMVSFPVTMRAPPTFVLITMSDVNVSSPTYNAVAGNSGMWLGGIPTATGGFILNRNFTASADL